MKLPELHWPGAVVAAALVIAIALVMIFADPHTSERLLEILGAALVGQALLPSVFRASLSTKPPIIKRPPDSGALALVLLVVAAALSSTTSGCGPTELQVHAQVARGLDDVARESGHVVRTWRTQRQRAAALAVHDAGGTEQEAIAAMHTAGDEAKPVVEAQRLFALGVHGYTLAALQHAAGDLDLPRFVRALRTMVDAYRSLRLLGVELHIEAIAAWPELPTILDTLLPPQLLAAASASATDGGAR